MSASALAADDAALLGRYPQVVAAAAHAERRTWALASLALLYVAFACWFFEITPQRLFGGLGNIAIVVRQMVVWKGFLGWDHLGIAVGLAETLAMALLGTLVAAVIAFPLGFLAAANIVRPAPLRHVVRRALDILRGIDALVWALVYVRAVGLGPLAGVLAIITRDIGDFGKLYSEAIENLDPKPIEGVRSVGGTRLQELRFGALPQLLPVFLSQLLYLFESNVRNATVLGVVGAGGIGLQLSERIRVQYWDQAAYIIVLMLIVVALIDSGSHALRRQLIGRRPG